MEEEKDEEPYSAPVIDQLVGLFSHLEIPLRRGGPFASGRRGAAFIAGRELSSPAVAVSCEQSQDEYQPENDRARMVPLIAATARAGDRIDPLSVTCIIRRAVGLIGGVDVFVGAAIPGGAVLATKHASIILVEGGRQDSFSRHSSVQMVITTG